MKVVEDLNGGKFKGPENANLCIRRMRLKIKGFHCFEATIKYLAMVEAFLTIN